MDDKSGLGEGVFGKNLRTDVEVVLDTDVARLSYDVRNKIVQHEFRSFVHGPALRAVLEKGLELFRARGAYKWLSDDRGNGPVTAADGEWALHDWAPRVIAAGWKYWAVVWATNGWRLKARRISRWVMKTSSLCAAMVIRLFRWSR